MDLGLSRQIFFCELGGFDTHGGQLAIRDALLQQLSQATGAFYQACSVGNKIGYSIASNSSAMTPPALPPTPPPRQNASYVIRESVRVLGVYIRGQLLVMAIVAGLYFVGFGLARVPLWPVIAVLGGLLEFIPNFGSLIALSLALFSAWAGGGDLMRLGIILAIWLVVQTVENYYLVPRFLGRRLGLSPWVVFLGVLLGGILFPPFGVFLAIPVLAVANVVRLFLRARRAP